MKDAHFYRIQPILSITISVKPPLGCKCQGRDGARVLTSRYTPLGDLHLAYGRCSKK